MHPPLPECGMAQPYGFVAPTAPTPPFDEEGDAELEVVEVESDSDSMRAECGSSGQVDDRQVAEVQERVARLSSQGGIPPSWIMEALEHSSQLGPALWQSPYVPRRDYGLRQWHLEELEQRLSQQEAPFHLPFQAPAQQEFTAQHGHNIFQHQQEECLHSLLQRTSQLQAAQQQMPWQQAFSEQHCQQPPPHPMGQQPWPYSLERALIESQPDRYDD